MLLSIPFGPLRLGQVYQLLGSVEAQRTEELRNNAYEQDGSHLCASLHGSTKGSGDHRQPDNSLAGTCAGQPVCGSAGVEIRGRGL